MIPGRHRRLSRAKWLALPILFQLIRVAEGSSASRHVTDQVFLEADESYPSADLVLQQLSEVGLALTEQSEGFRSKPYDDIARYCTIGYGHLIRLCPCDDSASAASLQQCATLHPISGDFVAGISRDRAKSILSADLVRAQIGVADLVRITLDDGQYAALVDFTFNVGVQHLATSSLLKAVNARDYGQVPQQMRRWVLAQGKLIPQLKERREREIALFCLSNGTPGPPPASDVHLSPIDIMEGEQ
jgi:lysozyme